MSHCHGPWSHSICHIAAEPFRSNACVLAVIHCVLPPMCIVSQCHRTQYVLCTFSIPCRDLVTFCIQSLPRPVHRVCPVCWPCTTHSLAASPHFAESAYVRAVLHFLPLPSSPPHAHAHMHPSSHPMIPLLSPHSSSLPTTHLNPTLFIHVHLSSSGTFRCCPA